MTPPRITANPQADALALPVNRVSIPFLRVQERRWLLAAGDALAASAWMIAGYEIWRLLARPAAGNMNQIPWAWVIGASLFWLLVSWLAGGYDLARADRFMSAARATGTVALVTVVAALVAYYIFLKTYPRPALALVLVAVPLTVILWRALYAATLRRPTSATRLLVLGDAAICEALRAVASKQTGYYHVVGYVSDGGAGPWYLGHVEDLQRVAERYRAHRIVVAPSRSASTQFVAPLCACMERGIEVVDFNAAYEEIAEKVAVDQVEDSWLGALPTRSNVSSLQESAMRLLDLIGAAAGLLLSLVIAAPIALAILLDSGWPLIYAQRRVGRGGRTFMMYKFRSMRTDAEVEGPRWAIREDSRVTRVGAIIRKTHLDELPQLWNVLRGDMSLVGPRPERIEFTGDLSERLPFYRLRLTVRPGLTGLKQIRVGYAATTEEHLEVLRHDLYYIKHRSIALNVLIMARTLGSVFGMDGR